MFTPGTLWQSVVQRTAHANRTGAQRSIPTRCERVSDAGVDFLVRVVTRIDSKQSAPPVQPGTARRGGAGFDPFLPYEQDLFVADVTDRHVALLNKYNVVRHHLIIVTRYFEDQRAPLTLADMHALWRCMAEFPGLAFYNCGEVSGASQQHKHLQMVPLPLTPQGPAIPIEPVLALSKQGSSAGASCALPFAHAHSQVDPDWLVSPSTAAQHTHDAYCRMLSRLRLDPHQNVDGSPWLPPYNLLATREWMLLVPRTREFYEHISINALGFAGALLVRDGTQLEHLRGIGPMTALREVAGPA